MKNAAVYARTAQACPAAIQQQFERCSLAAQHLGLEPDARNRFQDDGVGGRCLPVGRPGYRSLEDLLAAGMCDVVLVDNASRLSRSSTHLGALLETFRRRGIRVFEAETGSELSLLTYWGKTPALGACAIPPKDADSRRRSPHR
ncbi:recombinase family protein [Hydrogenophaga intermedia]|uniref:recombinase family protein n=1 Tax=Hydrogenophaga intermedia TaxID=65786 RepID=UPI003340AC6C